MTVRTEVCAKAEQLASLATENSWEASVLYATDHVDVALVGSWGFAETAEWWEWGFGLRWYRTESGWRLGDDGAGHPVLGNAMNVDGVPFDFWLRSVAVLRRVIVEPAELVELLNGFDAARKVAPR